MTEILLKEETKLNFSCLVFFGLVSGIFQKVHKDHKNHQIPTDAIEKRTTKSSFEVS